MLDWKTPSLSTWDKHSNRVWNQAQIKLEKTRHKRYSRALEYQLCLMFGGSIPTKFPVENIISFLGCIPLDVAFDGPYSSPRSAKECSVMLVHIHSSTIFEEVSVKKSRPSEPTLGVKASSTQLERLAIELASQTLSKTSLDATYLYSIRY
eukprot:gb/GECH01006572.1/.p1 GENE.gb/GECH01006572.1/~~gb/GECH01006572.1/.p1  ORF type:complete len:151 (+),score=5.96 gb/GECH01006572.1/:1-453(+)